MQTFLPYPDFRKSAQCLDSRRLNKQRIECGQILQALFSPPFKSKGWRNHPATLMWKGHEGALIRYALEICQECHRRFCHKESSREKNAKWLAAFNAFLEIAPTRSFLEPPWLGDVRFHTTHKRALLLKDAGYYGRFKWRVAPAIRNERGQIPYVWPVRSASALAREARRANKRGLTA